MHTFAQKPKATQQATSAKSTIPRRVQFRQSPEVNSILHLQRSIGNQAVQRFLQVNTEGLEVESSTTATTRLAHDFSRIPVYSGTLRSIQPKLMINAPGDQYEQEADRVADQVMRNPEPKLQFTCACGGGCPKCQSQPVQPNQEKKPLNGPQLSFKCSPAFGRLSVLSETETTLGQFGDIYEREADWVPAAVTAASGLGLAPLAIRPLSGPARIQRNGMAYAYIRQLQARQLYDSFVGNAERYGLPVRFLRRVGRNYSIGFGSSSAVNYWLNTMTLEEEDLRSASQMAPTLPVGEASAIRTIYEEATHAYLDLVSNEPRFSRFIAAGERHYQGARTTRGTTTTDPGRVFQEAAGTYVAHRAAVWWSTFESLSIFAGMSSSDPAAASRLRQRNMFGRLRDDYNRQMAEVVFGYSEEGGFLGIGSEQVETTRPMTGGMKTFLDHELLEDKIPDRFEAVAGFQQLLNLAGVALSGAATAPGPTPATTAPAVQRQPVREAHPSPPEALEGVGNVLRSSGRPLDAETRREMEQHFGHDFSRVRVHTDSRAAESAKALNSLAYAIGRDVVFGQGQYAPETITGKRLLAHELTHVVQQRQSD